MRIASACNYDVGKISAGCVVLFVFERVCDMYEMAAASARQKACSKAPWKLMQFARVLV